MIVERMGRFHLMQGPGWGVSIPFIDRCVMLDLEQILPGWRGQSKEQLEKKLVQQFYAGGAPGLGKASEPAAQDATLDRPEVKAALQLARKAAEEAAERQRRQSGSGTDGP